MKFGIETLGGETITAELSDVGVIYPDDDVVYINGVPCRISSAVAVLTAQTTIEPSNADIDAARDLLEALEAINIAAEGAMLPGPVYLSFAEVEAARAAIAKVK